MDRPPLPWAHAEPAPRSRGAERRFLYVTPYFPPQRRVGALRALKFARHLPPHGWAPVVLADLKRRDAMDPQLLEAVPDSSTVVRDYGRSARRAWRSFENGRTRSSRGGRRDPGHGAGDGAERRRRVRRRPPVAGNPEWIPLGTDALDIPHAIHAARRILAAYPCEAILVNAAPEAALLVGSRLAREVGLPLLLDLRDPWAPCELRRPRRPPPMRALVDRWERRAVEAARKVILTTETARDAYRRHYRALDPERFTIIGHGRDPGLHRASSHPGFDPFTLLFLGGFRRFLTGEVWVEVLAELRRRGATEGGAQLVVAGPVPGRLRRLARARGVSGMLRSGAWVPYPEIRSLMEAADLLVLETQPGGVQRIPAKLSDYLAARRPILAITENRELVELLGRAGGATAFRHDQVAGIADAVLEEMGRGRGRVVPHDLLGMTAAATAAALAHLLDEATAPPPRCMVPGGPPGRVSGPGPSRGGS